MATRDEVIDALRKHFEDLDASGLEQTLAQRVTGVIASDAFKELDHEARQQLLRQVLDQELDKQDQLNVGPIVVMTRNEALAHQMDAE